MVRKTFHIPPELDKELVAREGAFSEALRESLARYFALLAEERRTLAGRFTDGELGLILDLCNGTVLEAHTMLGGILANCEDGETERYEYHNANRTELLPKLRALNPAEDAALVDAVERWWLAVGHGFQPEVGQLLK